MIAAEIRRKRADRMRAWAQWQWHLDEVFVKINGQTHYLWRAVDHEGEVLEAYVTRRRDRHAALKFLRKAMKRYGNPEVIVTDRLKSYRAAKKTIGNEGSQDVGRWLNNRAENSHLTVPKKRAGHAQIQANAKSSKVRRRPFFRPQSLQSRASSQRQKLVQGEPAKRAGRMAATRRLTFISREKTDHFESSLTAPTTPRRLQHRMIAA